MELEQLKKDYAILEKKYKLPKFSVMNEYFEIEKLEKDTDFLLRDVRKIMMEKVVRYIQFVEMMINPSQAPPMFTLFLKNVSQDDRRTLEKIYSDFIKLELSSLRAEIDYSEKGEAELIKKINSTWEESRKDMALAIDIMERNWNSSSAKKDKSYFG